MTLDDIATRVHQQAGISKEESTRLFEWFMEFLKTTLHVGEPINIQGFGKFTVRSKRARPGLTPRTGEAIEISARRVVSFHASHLLNEEMNSSSEEEWERVA